MAEIKVFNRWSTQGIAVKDPGLVSYISLDNKIVPKTGARYAGKRFHKSKVFIVERLINKVMGPGHKSGKHFKTSGSMTGKAGTAANIVKDVFIRIEQQTKQNPVKILVDAIENGAPREEIVTIEYGGARYPKAVECGPQRRIDLALRYMTQGAFHRSFNSKKPIISTLTEEILAAASKNQFSNAISKKMEIERQADASR